MSEIDPLLKRAKCSVFKFTLCAAPFYMPTQSSPKDGVLMNESGFKGLEGIQDLKGKILQRDQSLCCIHWWTKTRNK